MVQPRVTRLPSGRHRPRFDGSEALRPAAVAAAYRLSHPDRPPAAGRRETRLKREKRARRTVARDRFLADANRGGHAQVVPA